MTKRESILSKIKKLLAMASGSANENEASQAASLAQKYMTEHDLCITDVDDITDVDTDITEEDAVAGGRLSTWRMRLLQGVAYNFKCSVVRYRGYKTTLSLVGTAGDISVSKVMYEYLVETVERLAKRNASGQGRTYANSYKLGMARRLWDRLNKQRRDAEAEAEGISTSTGRELVLVKDANLKSYMSKYGKGRSQRNSNVDYYAYAAGRQDGDRVSLNRQISGSSTDRLN